MSSGLGLLVKTFSLTMSLLLSTPPQLNPIGKIDLASGLVTGLPELDDIGAYIAGTVGKSFRPTICIAIAEIKNASCTIPSSVLTALETLHCFTLIHDDIVDRSLERRGQPALWRKYSSDIAILYGDFMHARAIELIAHEEKLSPSLRNHALKHFLLASSLVNQGQTLETLHLYDTEMSDETYRRIAAYKTGALIYLACELGRSIGCGNDKEEPLLQEFAEAFGIAFQIYNDIADFQQSHGKDSFTDLIEGKMTLPILIGIKNDSHPALRELKRIYTERVSVQIDPIEVVSALSTSGSFTEAYEIMEREIQRAEDTLAEFIGGIIPEDIQTIFLRFRGVMQNVAVASA